LSEEQVADYRRDGYLVVHDLLSAEEIDAFLAHQEIRQESWDIGLLSHTVDPQWKTVATHPNVAGGAEQLLGAAPRIVQSMYLPKKAGAKQPGIALHQDTHYLPTEPNTLMACWIAMSDTGVENGGLCVVPGSHLKPLRKTQQATSDEQVSWRMNYEMRDQDGKEWSEEFYSFEIEDLDPSSIAQLEVPAGGGVFFTGMTIHGSFGNPSATRDRLAFAVHYVGDGTWVYRADVQDTASVRELAQTV
jgi:ectoine hydroxylase-related dioxygenase (phytanoyl-CoA dioxygenase family)